MSNCEVALTRPDGTCVPVLFSAARMLDGHNETRVVTSARNITELNQIKVELASARDAALASARHKSEFLANMSHEIRTPMNGIVGMTDLLAMTELSHEQQEYVGAVQSSTESLLALINDILDLSKVEAGKLQVSPVAFAFRPWLDELLRPLALRASQKGLAFAGTVSGAFVSSVTVDPLRLRQVLVNLAGNAIKFTEQGEVEIAIALQMVGPRTARACFTVRDTGIGIPESMQRAIFESFTQADGSIARKYGGTGLGLTISSRLVELMGGELTLESTPGRGSRFSFTLDVPATETIERGALHARRVLVAARPGIRIRALTRILTELGASVTEVDRVAAEQAVRTSAFDFALVDGPLSDARIVAALPGRCVLLETARDRQEYREASGYRRILEPVREADLLELAGAAHAEARAPQPAASGRRILLVEDNLINQTVALRLLERRGHRVALAGTGEDAIAMAARERFDVILMDVQMPGMSGLEATSILRSRERDRRCPIVALTANAMNGDREACLAAGMDDYVSKPLRAEELFRAIDRLTA